MNNLRALRIDDPVLCTCDPSCPGLVVQGSTKTFVDNRQVARKGDRTTNCCGCSCPCPNFIMSGSTKTFIDNRPAARMGDLIRVGKAIGGSTKTFIG